MPGKIENRIALVFGTNGMVGGFIVRELQDHMAFSAVEVFNRKPIDYYHLKVREHTIDYNKLDEYAHLIKGDDLFICLGTTLRKAGSVQAVEQIDRDYPIRIAQIAYANGVSRVAVVSSMGANPSSRNYYLRIKGEMEQGIREIPFEQIVIARPSLLFGRRKDFRLGELIGKGFMLAIDFMMIGPLKKYAGISAHKVATAMIALLKSSNRDIVYQSNVLHKFGKR
jgi:uncharacterized protein YbjT (DUF2867 family)